MCTATHQGDSFNLIIHSLSHVIISMELSDEPACIHEICVYLQINIHCSVMLILTLDSIVPLTGCEQLPSGCLLPIVRNLRSHFACFKHTTTHSAQYRTPDRNYKRPSILMHSYIWFITTSTSDFSIYTSAKLLVLGSDNLSWDNHCKHTKSIVKKYQKG